MAKAREAQEPEPSPEKQREAEAEGSKPVGQGEEGKESSKPPSVAKWRIKAQERAAKAPRPGPKEAARKTIAEGKAARAEESSPAAQPVATVAEGGQAATTSEKVEGVEEREPEKPRRVAEPRAEERAEGSIGNS